MKINIQPVSIWTSNGAVSASSFEVRYINYTAPTAVADCHIWAGSVEVSSMVVNATAEQCDEWSDDVEFAAVLASNIGLIVVAPTPTPTPTVTVTTTPTVTPTVTATPDV